MRCLALISVSKCLFLQVVLVGSVSSYYMYQLLLVRGLL